MAEPLRTFEEAARHGGIVRLQSLWPRNFILVSDPDLIETVVEEKSGNFVTGFTGNPYHTLFGPSLISVNSAENKARRRVEAPQFRRNVVAAMADRVISEVDAMFARWAKLPAGEWVDMREEFVPLQLRISGSLLFSHNFEGQTEWFLDAWKRMMDDLLQVSIYEHSPILRHYSTPARRRFGRSRRAVIRLFAKLIQDRRAGITSGDDMLTALLEARDAQGRPWADEIIGAEMFHMIGGGMETTASTLVWSFYRLSKHPEVETRLHAELDDFEPPLDWKAVSESPYLNWTLNEILRLHLPIHLIARVASQEEELGGHCIPKGALVGLLPFMAQIDPRYWDEPSRFWPERFDPDQKIERPKYAFLPFGGGPRVCTGAHMARVVLLLVLANIARKYRLILPEGFTTTPRNTGWARDPVKFRIEPRV